MESTKGCIIKHKSLKISLQSIEEIVIQVVTLRDLNGIQLDFGGIVTNPKQNGEIYQFDF